MSEIDFGRIGDDIVCLSLAEFNAVGSAPVFGLKSEPAVPWTLLVSGMPSSATP